MSIRKRVNLLESDNDILRSHIQVLEAQFALLVARIEMLETRMFAPWWDGTLRDGSADCCSTDMPVSQN